MELLKSQKNQIFDILSKENFFPGNFDFLKEGDNNRLYFKNNKNFFFYFLVDGNFSAYFAPGHNTSQERVIASSWTSLVDHFKYWLSYLKREVEQPDKWDSLLNESEFFKSDMDEKNNINFSYVEINQINDSVNKIVEGIKTLNLSEPEFSEINKKLNYLIDKSKILGRVDWKNIAIGTFVGTAAQLSTQYPPETVKIFIQIVKNSFKLILLLN